MNISVQLGFRWVILVTFVLCTLALTTAEGRWIWYYPGSNWFYLSKHRRNFYTARSICKSLNAKLVKITDSKMDRFLYEEIKQTGQGHYIGLNDIKNENTFVWNDEGREPTYFNWEPGQPNHYYNQDCVTLRNVDGKWNDSPCDEHKRFICETTPQRWIRYSPGNTWLYLSKRRGSFITARYVCESMDAKLVKITNSRMDRFLHKKIKRTGQGHYIGLNDIKESKRFMWNDEWNEPTYFNWEPGQPNHYYNQDCVTLRNADGKWNDSPCDEHKRFICQKTPRSKYSATFCPEGWIKYAPGDTCIYLSNKERSFLAAKSVCKYFNAELVKIANRRMDEFLYSKIKSTKQGHYIGLTDAYEENKFKWNDEIWEPTYFNWEPGQPNNYYNQDCVTLRNADGKWNDSPCDEHKRFICQKPAQIKTIA